MQGRSPTVREGVGQSQDGRPPSRSGFCRFNAGVLCVALLALMGAQMLFVIKQKSITVDELVLIPAGFYHLTAGDFRPVHEHPPVAKVLGGAPLVALGAGAPPIEPGAHDYDYFFGRFDEFWRMNAGRLDYLCFWARVPAIGLTLLLGALVFVFTRRHWGARAALFAVALYAFEPTILAHGRVVQTDVPSALALLIFSFALYAYLKSPHGVRAACVGGAAGFAAVTKFSMVVLGPVLCMMFAGLFVLAPHKGLKRTRVAGHAVATALAAVLIVNAGYFFQRTSPESFEDALTRSVVTYDLGEGALRTALDTGHQLLQFIFPPDFVSGVGWQLGHAKVGHPAGLLGDYSQHGWWYYFPVAFVLKTPLPILLLTLAGLVWGLTRLRRARDGRLLVLLVPPALFTLLVMFSSINIGVRYYIPAYPFFFILAGVMLDDLLRSGALRRRLAVVLVVVSFGWTVWEAGRAYPDHMSYMNQLTSGAPRWWYLSDSNVEWGDDVRNLALYLRDRGETRVGGALLAWQLLGLYGIEQTAVFVPPGAPVEETRYVAVGASLLNGSTVPGVFDGGWELNEYERVNYFEDYRRRTPEKIFGGSIYLYRMKE